MVGGGTGIGEDEGEEDVTGGVECSPASTMGEEGGVGRSSSGTIRTTITFPILGLFSITTFELSSAEKGGEKYKLHCKQGER